MAKKQVDKTKAISIKGKEYILVKDRVIFFNDEFPNGSIQTELLSSPDAERVVFKAIAIPDVSNPTRFFTGYSQATWDDGYINKAAAMENCETSAIGRCLASMGIGVLDSIASADEMHKAEYQSQPVEPLSDKQFKALGLGLQRLGVPEEYCGETKFKVGSNEIMLKDLNKKQASMVMGKMMNKEDRGAGFKELVIGLPKEDEEKVEDIDLSQLPDVF